MPFTTSPSRFLAHYVGARWRLFLLLTMAVFGAAISAVGVQYAMKVLIDRMTATPHAAAPVYAMLALFIALVALESVLQRVAAFMLGHATIVSGTRIRLDAFDYLSAHQLTFFQDQRAGALGHRISGLTGAFAALIHRILLEITPPLIGFVGALAIFLSIDVWMSVVLGPIFLMVTAALVALGLRGDVRHREFARRAGVVGGELVDLISNIWVIKAFAMRRRELARLHGFLADEGDAQRRSWFFVERMRGLHDVSLVVLVGGALTWAVHRWSAGAISTGDVVVVSAMTFRMVYGARDLAMALIATGQQFSYLGETLEIIGAPQTLRDAPDAMPLRIESGTLRFVGVTFGYDPQRPVLHDLSFEIAAGQKVGIVGASGAGKSSILHLVQRLHDVQSGTVSIDGQAVRAVTQESLHAAIAVVPQDVMMFHRSIMENIRFARPDADDADVRRAAEAAGCGGFIDLLPHGYDSIVGERGTSLSGGQRQRIGIARAFLKDSPIVLLDEATSALDTGSELEVQRGLQALMTDRTVLGIAHRLSTIAGFDRVLVIEDGRIVEDGPPQHLLQRADGAFRRLWLLQADGIALPPEAPPRRRMARLRAV